MVRKKVRKQPAKTLDRDEMERRLLKLAKKRQLRVWRAAYDALSRPEQVLRLVWELESEINNGGSTSISPTAAAVMLPKSRLPCARWAPWRRRALPSAPSRPSARPPWDSDAARQDRMIDLPERVPNRLDALDQKFYGYPDDLTVLLYRYVARHRKDIGAPTNF